MKLTLSVFVAVFGLTLSSVTWAKEPTCTTEKTGWKDQKAFEQGLKDQGYKVKVFKVTKGNCYELYGWNKEGKKVEIYFNPISGDAVKSEIQK